MVPGGWADSYERGTPLAVPAMHSLMAARLRPGRYRSEFTQEKPSTLTTREAQQPDAKLGPS